MATFVLLIFFLLTSFWSLGFTDSGIQKRLFAQTCELCGTHSKYVKVYHAGSMKELDLSTPWGKKMMDIRRKTLVVCKECYNTIHGNKESK